MSPLIGRPLRTVRERRQLSQRALAEQAGVTQVYLHELETGKKANPSLQILEALAKALRVSISELIG